MKKLFLFGTIASTMLFAGCGTTSRFLSTNQNVNQTTVELSRSNSRIIGDVTGTARAVYVFGIGGLSYKAVTANATVGMYRNARWSGSQAVITINTEAKRLGVPGIYTQRQVTTSGQIVEFIGK